MFVTKVGDIITCGNGSFEVQKQFVYKGQGFLVLSSVTAKFEDLVLKKAPIYIAREIVNESKEKLYIEIIEDQKLIEEIKQYLNK